MRLLAPTLLLLSLPCVIAQDNPTDDPPVQIAKAIPVTSTAPAPTAKPAEEKADDSPAKLPKLDHFARLWTDSLFTTRALPMPDVPAGPSFVDNYTLSGTLEDRGKMVAILIDKTTSNVVEAYIGKDNDAGFRIAKIEPGETADKMRIQLQKGNQSGWLGFVDAGPSDGGMPTQNPPPQTAGPLATRPGNAPPVRRATPIVPPQIAQPIPTAIPPQPQGVDLRGGAPDAPVTLPGDPPLPPQ